MKIIVLLKQVPDIVEEIEIAPDGKDLVRDDLKYRLNEFDDYALEEALLLKASAGAEVIALALDAEEADQILYTAIAKGVDRAIKVTGDAASPRVAALRLAEAVRGLGADLVLCGVQAPDDLEGQLAPLVGAALGWPHANVVSGLEVAGSTLKVTQEFSGGLVAHLEGELPVVLGVQASREAPRYAPITRVRQAMQSGKLETVAATTVTAPEVTLRRLAKPESSGHAEMIEGSVEEIAERIAALLRERGFGGKS